MLIRMSVLKVINNEGIILTHHEIIDRIVKQTVFVITSMQLTKIMNSFKFTAVKFLIYLFI